MGTMRFFRSADDQEAYFQAYNQAMSLWPLEPDQVDIPTSYGKTHVYICGPQDGAPLVLLHGRNATSAMWFANIGEWSKRYKVYAIDTIGEPGKSERGDRSIRGQRDYADWLTEVLKELGIQQASFVGHSYGAWLALGFTLHYPHQVARLALLEPAQSFSYFTIPFALWGVRLLIFPTQRNLEKFFAWESQGCSPNPHWIKLMILGISTYCSAKEVVATVLSRRELGRITQPVLLIIGGKSVIRINTTATKRARKHLSDVQIVTLADASHNIPIDEPETVNRLVQEFLDNRTRRSTPSSQSNTIG